MLVQINNPSSEYHMKIGKASIMVVPMSGHQSVTGYWTVMFDNALPIEVHESKLIFLCGE